MSAILKLAPKFRVGVPKFGIGALKFGRGATKFGTNISSPTDKDGIWTVLNKFD